MQGRKREMLRSGATGNAFLVHSCALKCHLHKWNASEMTKALLKPVPQTVQSTNWRSKHVVEDLGNHEAPGQAGQACHTGGRHASTGATRVVPVLIPVSIAGAIADLTLIGGARLICTATVGWAAPVGWAATVGWAVGRGIGRGARLAITDGLPLNDLARLVFAVLGSAILVCAMLESGILVSGVLVPAVLVSVVPVRMCGAVLRRVRRPGALTATHVDGTWPGVSSEQSWS